MFWNVTFIYNAFIRTTDHCKVQTAFVSLFYIFINMKPWNAYYPGTRGSPTLGHLTNFCTNFYDFLISENSLKFANFFCWGNEFSIYGIKLSVNTMKNPGCVPDFCQHSINVSVVYINLFRNFHEYELITFWVILLTNRQTNIGETSTPPRHKWQR